MSLKVYAKLGNVGLGNKLYIFVKALLFAQKYNADFYRSSWVNFHPKAYLRNLTRKQKDLRMYIKHF